MSASQPATPQSSVTREPARAEGPLGGSLLGNLLKFGGLALIDVFAVWFVLALLGNDAFLLALFAIVVTLGINAAFLVPGLYPYRWFSPGLTLMIIIIIYPTLFTVYVAFTNFRTGNLLTQPQAELRFESDQFLYLPEGAPTYTYTAYRATIEGETRYALWLVPEAEDGSAPILALEGESVSAEELDLGSVELDEDGIPQALPGAYNAYTPIPRNEILALLDGVLTQVQFGDDDTTYLLNPRRPTRQVGVFEPRYELTDDGAVIDRETETTYTPVEGTYTAPDGSTLSGGYYVVVGLDNFEELINDQSVRDSFFRVFLWTVAFAFFSVFFTFSLGLFLALVINAPFMPGRAVIRTLLLVPYAIPAFITVLVWRGLLNEQLGVVNDLIASLPGIERGPRWFSDPPWPSWGFCWCSSGWASPTCC
ncbi:MAG: hypothetical protein HC915_17205 [Anaerolineae bacterium]|nr:hypothetical protein [Anaerolineae bacterium]